MKSERIGVLFVCLGNICRSPLAEAVFRTLVDEAGLRDRFDIDSAGTSGYHDGEGPDARTVEVARRRGVHVAGVARKITRKDLHRFHYILAMDADNLTKLRMLDTGSGTRFRLLRSFDADSWSDAGVPDPYYGGARGFEDVHDIVERACRGLLAHIRKEHGL